VHTLIDLRWMIPGYTGGIENMARSMLNTMIQIDESNQYTVLLPSVTRYDFNIAGRPNFHLQMCDDVGYYLAKLSLLLQTKLLGKTFQKDETWVQGRKTNAQIALSPSGIIYPDLYSFKNLLILPDLQHEFFPEFFSPLELENRRKYYSASVNRANQIITISEFTRQTVIERMQIPPERISTAYLGVDARSKESLIHSNEVMSKYHLEKNQYLFFPANTWPHKNHRTALQALYWLKKKHDLKPLLICTGAPKEAHPELIELSLQLELQDQFHFLGYCPPEDIPVFYHEAAALVFPSLFEGFGMPVVEAMSLDCPVICSNTTSLPEIAGDAALFIDPNDTEMLAEAIFQVMTDPTLRQQLIHRGRQRAKHFSWGSFTNEILNALHQLGGEENKDKTWQDLGTTQQVDLPGKPNRQERAQALIHQSYEDWRHAKRTSSAGNILNAVVIGPEVVFTTFLFPIFRDRVLRKIFKWFHL
jgi:glycosyltransferase involved in cell wall biosynthesis